MKIRLILTGVLCAGAAHLAWAAEAVEWQKKDGVWSGPFDEPGHWNPARVPTEGDQAKIYVPEGDVITNTFPAGDCEVKASLFFNLGGSSASYVFDGRGSVVRQPTINSASYLDEPFALCYCGDGRHLLNLQTYSESGETYHNKDAISTITNGLMRYGISGDFMNVDFLGGDWNFYDPEGFARPKRYFHVGYYTNVGGKNLRFRFFDGHVRFPQMWFPANVDSNRELIWDVIGGRQEIMGNVDLPSQYGKNSNANISYLFQVTNNAEIVFAGDVQIGGKADAARGGQPYYDRTYRFRASGEGAKMTFRNSTVTHSTGGTFLMDVLDGAEIDMWSAFKIGDSSNVDGIVTVSNATLRANVVTVGAQDATNQTAKVIVRDGGVLDTTGETAAAESSFYVRSGSLEVTNAIWCGKTALVGAGTNTAKIVAKDSTVSFSSGFTLGDAGPAEMTLEDTTSSFASTLSVGRAGEGTLVVNGGTVDVKDLVIADSTKHGQVEVRSGVLNVSSSIQLGSYVVGDMLVSGGKVVTKYLWSGLNYSAAPVSTLRQTGGTIQVTATGAPNTGCKLTDSSSRRVQLVLDGGTMITDHIFSGNGAQCRGGTGFAGLTANGGKVSVPNQVPPSGKSYGLIEMLDEAKLGAKGLTIESDYAVTIPQDFADQDDAQGEGLLRLTGSGVKTLTAENSTVSKIELDGGELRILPLSGAEKVQDSSISIAGGTTLSLAGDLTKLTVKDLTFGDAGGAGILRLDPGDVIEVTGKLAVAGLGIALTGAYSIGDVCDCICVTGDQTASLSEVWSRIHVVSGRGDGQGYAFEVAYDGTKNRTIVRMNVIDGSQALTDTEWNGTTSTWGTGANWSRGENPGVGSRAIFASESAEKEVSLGGAQPLGALAFRAAQGYALKDGRLAFADLAAGGAIEATKGSNVVAAAMALPNTANVSVASGAALDVSGEVTATTLSKGGHGCLILSGTNAIAETIVADGTYATQGAAAWNGVQTLRLNGGAVAFADNSDVEMRLDMKTAIDAPAKMPILLRADTDVVMSAPKQVASNWNMMYGMPYKFGPGRLTLEVSEAESDGHFAYCTSVEGDWCPNYKGNRPASIVAFDEDGLIPSGTEVAGVTVADGELVFRGVTESPNNYNMQTYVAIGEPGATVSLPPTMTIDHVNMNANRRHFLVGAGLEDGNTTASDVYLNVTNGASLSVDTFYVSRDAKRTGLKQHIRVADGATVSSGYMTHANCCTGVGSEAEFLVVNGSKFLAGDQINFATRAKLIFDNSILAKNASLDPTKITYETNVKGTTASGGDLLFRNGSKAYLDSVSAYATAEKATTLTFDGSEWIPGSGDFTFVFANPDKIQIIAEGGGLILDVPNAKTWTMNAQVTGTGGIVKRGGGTLAVASTALACTGVTVVEAGALDLQGGEVKMSGLATSGTGIVRNGTLSCTAPYEVDADWNVLSGSVPNLDASVTVKRLAVDFGRTVENPVAEPFKTIEIGTYSGMAPSFANWRVTGTGLRNVRGIFEARDGKILMTLEHTGIVLIVR